MEDKSRLLTIGQFAGLHGINKKTLMWYDEIGLFRPAAVNPVNRYRYYNYHQSALLETILLLRELNASIDEIQNFMKNRSAESMRELIDEKIRELDQELEHLRAVRKTLGNHRQNMDTLLSMDLADITVVEKETRCLVTVDIDQETSYDKQVEMITAETRKCQLRRLHDASYGTMISVENLEKGDYDSYSKLFIEIPFPTPKTELHIQPQGTYIRAFYQGDWRKMSSRYEEIFDYAKSHNLSLSGYSYEMIINENVTDRKEDYIVQIEIPADFRG